MSNQIGVQVHMIVPSSQSNQLDTSACIVKMNTFYVNKPCTSWNVVALFFRSSPNLNQVANAANLPTHHSMEHGIPCCTNTLKPQHPFLCFRVHFSSYLTSHCFPKCVMENVFQMSQLWIHFRFTTCINKQCQCHVPKWMLCLCKRSLNWTNSRYVNLVYFILPHV